MDHARRGGSFDAGNSGFDIVVDEGIASTSAPSSPEAGARRAASAYFGQRGGLQVGHRIHGPPVLAHFEVQVRARIVATDPTSPSSVSGVTRSPSTWFVRL